jgi:hypothetical protein
MWQHPSFIIIGLYITVSGTEPKGIERPFGIPSVSDIVAITAR